MTSIQAQLHCALCGADLQGHALDAACAHCGQPVAESIDTNLVDSETMSVGTDASCAGCGYNLRTLRIESACPECFRPVVESLRPNELRFADRKWLQRVREGITLLLVAAFGIAAVFVGLPVLGAFSGGLVAVAPWWLSLPGMVVCAVLGCWGVFAATRSDPRRRASPRSNVARNVGRVSVLLPVLLFAILTFANLGGAGWTGLAGSMLITLGPMISVICTLICLRRLSASGRRPGLSQLTAVLIWLVACGGASGITGTVLITIQTRQMMASFAATGPATTPPTASPDATGAPAPSDHAVDGTDESGSLIDANRTGGQSKSGDENSSDNATSSDRATTTVTVSPNGTVVTAPGPTGVPAAPFPMPRQLLMILSGVAMCGSAIVAVACYVIGLIVLMKYRRLLGAALGRRDTS